MSPGVAASVKARLLGKATEEREEFERTLARYAAERLLFRLGASGAKSRCVLKGASLLAAWLPDPYRATRDIDVLAFGSSDDAAIRALVEEICAVSCSEDGLRFDLSTLSVAAIRAEDEYSGKRARFVAWLGKARIRVQMDFGFGDALVGDAAEITLPTLLPTLPAPRLRAYSRESSIAEKVEAMVKLDVRNSRMKDFHDVWALSSALSFEGTALRWAIAACFERRATPWITELPRCLTPNFYENHELATRWRNYLASGAVLVPPPAQFEIIGGRVISFIAPVRSSIVEAMPFESAWSPNGPWTTLSRRQEPMP